MSPSPDPSLHDRALDELASLALGEPVDADIAEHVAHCPECRDELAALRATVRAARHGTAPGTEAPPAAVWQRIAEQVAVPVRDDEPPAPTPLRRRRPWNRAAQLLVAAALVAGAAVGGWAIGHSDSGGTTGGTARAALSAQPGTGANAHGVAEMHESADGFRMNLKTAGLPATNGYYEVWLYDPSAQRMVAIGTLGTGATGTFTVPAGIDTRAYHVVDVSLQRFDGNPAHQRSVLRGQLVRT